MVASPEAVRGRVFYGWWVVAGALVVLTTSAGLGFYGIPVYLRALVTERGFSLGDASAATALFFAVVGASGLGVARLIARRDARVSITIGAVVAAAALVLLGRVEQRWQLFAVYALFGLGFSASALVPATTLVTRWFSRRRSVALSIASTGLSLGGVVVVPLTSTAIGRVGLGGVTPWLALAYLLGVVPAALLLLRPDPASMGLHPDGDAAPSPGSGLTDGTPRDLAIRSRYFRHLTGGFVLVMLAQVGALAHVFNLVAERGDEALGAAAVSAVAVASIIGRLAGGWLVTRIDMRRFAVVLAVVQGASLLAIGGAGLPPALLACSVLFGLTIGNLLMLHPLLVADAFGVRDYPRIFSLSQFITTVGIAAGPALVGALASASGYGVATLAVAASSIGGAVVLASSGSVSSGIPAA